MLEKFLTKAMKTPGVFVMLTAPPAFGKTAILRQLLPDIGGVWLYFSPLVAINKEVAAQFKTSNFLVINLKQIKSREELNSLINRNVLIVATPESFFFNPMRFALFDFPSLKIVLDEFHLFFEWGESFRSHLLAIIFELPWETSSILALSATINPVIESEVRYWPKLVNASLYWLNWGNLSLKNLPQKIIYQSYWGRKKLLNNLEHYLEKYGAPIIIFLKYRRQVDFWCEHYNSLGLLSAKAKGGELDQFEKFMSTSQEVSGNELKIIFSTQVLSHGVNLPSLKAVIISFPLNNLSWWLQMAGRGGRKGEKFVLISCDDFFITKGRKNYYRLTQMLSCLMGKIIKSIFPF